MIGRFNPLNGEWTSGGGGGAAAGDFSTALCLLSRPNGTKTFFV